MDVGTLSNHVKSCVSWLCGDLVSIRANGKSSTLPLPLPSLQLCVSLLFDQ